MTHIFDKKYGPEKLKNPLVIAALLSLFAAMAFMIVKGGLIAGVGLLALPIIVAFLAFIFLSPRGTLITIFIINYVVLGLSRYISVSIPLGLSIDILLILIYVALFFKNFSGKIPWHNAKNDLVLLAALWYAYALFQLVNPEASSRVAWFYAMRGVSLYMLLVIPIVFIIFNKPKDIEAFLKVWAVLALIASLKGIQQKILGPDPWEQAWLNGGGNLTHMLFGQLRVFSFFTDAGQFGGAQGHAGVVFGILALNPNKKTRTRIFYALVSALGIYGMMISGTRGSLAVPIFGFGLYLILSKNVKVLVLGTILGLGVLVFFKYTTIGEGNYTIRRMRTAFNPEDASLQVRLNNQRKLKSYMASRPFGGGIGSAGDWGQRFSPGTFLAETPTDSWYVMIWTEQGIIGLILHLFILFYILGKSAYIIMFRLNDPTIRFQMSALASGIFGIMGASYGNGVLGQMPTGVIIYTSMAFLFLAEKIDKELIIKEHPTSSPKLLK